MFTLLPKEQAHVTVVYSNKKYYFRFSPRYCIGSHLDIDLCSVLNGRGAFSFFFFFFAY